MAARALTGTESDATKAIVYKSGDPLDLRPSNVRVIPYYLARLKRNEPLKRNETPPPTPATTCP